MRLNSLSAKKIVFLVIMVNYEKRMKSSPISTKFGKNSRNYKSLSSSPDMLDWSKNPCQATVPLKSNPLNGKHINDLSFIPPRFSLGLSMKVCKKGGALIYPCSKSSALLEPFQAD
jgi:hypothetical protein